jgi:hypothetical protein
MVNELVTGGPKNGFGTGSVREPYCALSVEVRPPVSGPSPTASRSCSTDTVDASAAGSPSRGVGSAPPSSEGRTGDCQASESGLGIGT